MLQLTHTTPLKFTFFGYASGHCRLVHLIGDMVDHYKEKVYIC
jgi:hypothetical protein